jgi:hypothetical protein
MERKYQAIVDLDITDNGSKSLQNWDTKFYRYMMQSFPKMDKK